MSDKTVMSDEIVSILCEVRSLLDRDNNDFAWSRWKDKSEALGELDALLGRVHAGETISISEVHFIFAPTGSLQEVSISSGWGDAFLSLANRFDAAAAEL